MEYACLNLPHPLRPPLCFPLGMHNDFPISSVLQFLDIFFFKKKLHWVFVAMHGLSLVEVSSGYSFFFFHVEEYLFIYLFIFYFFFYL